MSPAVRLSASERYFSFVDLCAWNDRLLHRGQVFHYEQPIVRYLLDGYLVLENLSILGRFGKLDHIAFQFLYQIIIKALRSKSLRALFLAPMLLNSKRYWSL